MISLTLAGGFCWKDRQQTAAETKSGRRKTNVGSQTQMLRGEEDWKVNPRWGGEMWGRVDSIAVSLFVNNETAMLSREGID